MSTMSLLPKPDNKIRKSFSVGEDVFMIKAPVSPEKNIPIPIPNNRDRTQEMNKFFGKKSLENLDLIVEDAEFKDRNRAQLFEEENDFIRE
jgi:hypothetical protein